MVPINFAVVKFSLITAAGIVAAYLFPSSFLFLKILPFCLVLLLLIKWWEGRKLQLGVFFGIATYITFFITGYSCYQIGLPEFQKDHYFHFTNKRNSELIQIKVIEVLKQDRYNHKYIAETLQLNEKHTRGKLLINYAKDSIAPRLQVDQLLLLSSEILEIPPPPNPHQFNYKKYLQHLGVYHQLRISNENVLHSSSGKSSLRGISEKIRSEFIHKLTLTPLEPNQRAILQALVLGKRTVISPELRGDYAAAGVLHILAVSGLHVGILFLLLSQLLRPLDMMRFGKPFKSVVIISCLWAFAFFTGLSPSVVRAVTMFSCFAFANALNRPTNGFNTLFLSFFLLILIKPSWLFQVGFQLSYLAVFAILWIQPTLYKLYRPRHRLDKLFWGIITVTTAAQLGVAPLSIFYFHQFPGLFFLSNLVVLPFLSILLISGILVVILAAFNILPNWLAELYNWLLLQLNNFISWIASHHNFVLEEISLSLWKMLGIYLLLAVIIKWLFAKGDRKPMHVLGSIVVLVCIYIWEDKITTTNQLVVFHKTRSTLIGLQKESSLELYHSDSLNPANTYPLAGYKIGENIKQCSSHSIPKVFRYRDKIVLVIDSLGSYPADSFDVVILSYSSKLHLERLIDSTHPKIIVADGSNYRSYVERWKRTSEKRSITFYSTYEKGAYIIR